MLARTPPEAIAGTDGLLSVENLSVSYRGVAALVDQFEQHLPRRLTVIADRVGVDAVAHGRLGRLVLSVSKEDRGLVDDRARARAILHQHRLAQSFGHARSDGAGDQVRTAAGRERNEGLH